MIRRPPTTRGREAIIESIPAPIGGWNARDPISAMDKADAIDLENIFPTPSDVMLRQGYSDQVTSVAGGQVESLMAYSSPTGTTALYAAAGTAIYNATQTTATASVAVSGLTNARWEHINFTNTSGVSYLLMVNGADGYRGFDGTTWSSLSITGTTASNLSHIAQHKNRVWFAKDNTLEAWYLNTDAVSGTASRIDLSAFCRKGGEIQAIGTWTIDAGEGMDDYWVAATTEGEVIVYKGTDPTAASTWTMVGKWELGRPLSRRCFQKFAGDLLYLADDALWPLSGALITAATKPRIALSDKINDAFRSAAENYRNNFGWQVLFWPRGTMILVNVPISTGSSQQQYVMNSISGSWCRFTGVRANCFEVYQGNIYYGGNGFVSRFWNTFADDGTQITGNAKQAFHYYRNKNLKQFVMARPILQSNGSPAISFGVNTDYDDSNVLSTLSFSPTTYAAWDSAIWDTDVWGGGLTVSRDWQNISGIGFCAAPRFRTQANGLEVRWQATDILYKPGAVI